MAASPASRVAVLTGCTRGLGLSLVAAFDAAGARVAGCGRSAAGVAALSARFPAPRHLFAVVDVADDAAVAAFAAAVRAWAAGGSGGGAAAGAAAAVAAAAGAVPPPMLVIANAAVMLEPAPLWSVPAAAFDDLLRVNVSGVANTARHFAPLLLEAPSGGVFVALSSYWGRSTSAGVAPYNASKYAVEGLVGALAKDFAKAAPKRVAAVAMNPGVRICAPRRRCKQAAHSLSHSLCARAPAIRAGDPHGHARDRLRHRGCGSQRQARGVGEGGRSIPARNDGAR
jgi:NAD(P)-dependent dehydrogenase (short-subunit alcohol dehydrogenase family)